MILLNDDSLLYERLWHIITIFRHLYGSKTQCDRNIHKCVRFTISLIDFNCKCILVLNKHELPVS